MSEPKLCSDNSMCKAMDECVQFGDVKGLVRKTYINLNTGKTSGHIIGYQIKPGKKAKWWAFRVCPFCAQPINQWILQRPENQGD